MGAAADNAWPPARRALRRAGRRARANDGALTRR